jgi:hypothetical protein
MHAATAAAEAVRALRPSGALAIWWNDIDCQDESWWLDQQERLERADPTHRRDYRVADHRAVLQAIGLFAVVHTAECRWTRLLDMDTYLAWLRSKSYVARLGPALPGFLAEERRSPTQAFPDGMVEERFVSACGWQRHRRLPPRRRCRLHRSPARPLIDCAVAVR